MSKKEQLLVNAQTEVNRCVFEMNQQQNRRAGISDIRSSVASDAYIVRHLDAAINDLQQARRVYNAKIKRGDVAANSDSLPIPAFLRPQSLVCPKHETGGGPCYCAGSIYNPPE